AREAAILRAERQLAMLDRMADLAMALAEGLQRRALAEAAAAEPPPRPVGRDPSENFVRVTRAVRLTLAMQMRLEESIRLLIEGPPANPKAAAATNPWGRQDLDEAAGHKPKTPYRHPADFNDGTRPEAVRNLVWDVINHDLED